MDDLFLKLANENADVDPEDGQRAPLRRQSSDGARRLPELGMKEINLPADPYRAVDYLHHAATFFGDKDAQFELAKVYLGGGSSPEDVKRGMHYLSVLSEESYPGAQAYLAILFWRGRYVKKDERRALALIKMATENAPEHERVWIEDIYQNIYCGASARNASAGGWHRGAMAQDILASRCRQRAHGAWEPADLQPQRGRQRRTGRRKSRRRACDGTATGAPSVVQGSTTSLGFRDAGAAGSLALRPSLSICRRGNCRRGCRSRSGFHRE